MRFRVFMALLVAVGVGAFVAIVEYRLALDSHHRAESLYTTQLTEQRLALSEGAIKRAVAQVDLLVAYYESAPAIARNDLSSFLQSIWVQNPDWDSFSSMPIAVGWIDVSRAPDAAVLRYLGGSPGDIVFSRRFGQILDEIVVKTHRGSGALLYRGRPDADDFDGNVGHYFTILKSAFKISPDGRRILRGTAFIVMDVQALLSETLSDSTISPMMAVFLGADSNDTILNETGSPIAEQAQYSSIWQPPIRRVNIQGQDIGIAFFRDPAWSYSHNTSEEVLDVARKQTATLIGGGVALFLFFVLVFFLRQNDRLRDLNQKAEAAAVAKADFLASMSHEIRTPMNGIFGMTELLAQTGLTPQQKRYVDTVLFSAEGLLVIIDDILDYSKLEVGMVELDPVPTVIVDCVDDVTRLLSVRARRKAIELNLRVARNFPDCAIVDPSRLRQIVTNLLGNAIKFTEKGQIVVTLETAERETERAEEVWIRISIEDSGIGIAEENIDKIFERFSQSDRSTTRQFGGTGLGLAICKQFAELMGGEIGVESRLGEGSTFWFEIPVVVTDAIVPEKLTGDELQGRRILVIEDKLLSAALIEEILVSAGATVRTCQKPEQALAVLLQASADSDPFDMALIDYQMPGMKGDAVARAIREEHALADIHLVLVSAVNPGHLKAGTASGLFDGAISKPFKPTALVQQICESLDPSAVRPVGPVLAGEADGTGKRFPGAKVLVAEDSAINQAYIQETLERFGCIVTIAENGEEAVRRVSNRKFDLVLMDCHMPIMDGFEATAEIMKRVNSGAVPEVPIIALTADVLAENRERCRTAGMVDHLSKPIRQEVLAKALSKWLAPTDAPEAVGPGPAADSHVPAATPGEPQHSAPEQRTTVPADYEADYVDEAVIQNGLDLFEEEFWPLVDRYLNDLVGYIDTIDKAFDEKRHADIHMPAHSIKSSSRQIGAMRMGEVAARVEAFVMPGGEVDAAALERALDDLRKAGETTREKLKEARAA